MAQCGRVRCEMDAVTFDDLDENEKCVAAEENLCVSCRTAELIAKQDQNFYRNPGQVLFNKEMSNEQQQFLWSQLKENCNMEQKQLAEEKLEFIPPNVLEAKSHLAEIRRFVSEDQFPYFQAMFNIVATSYRIVKDFETLRPAQLNHYEYLLKQEYRDYLQAGGWSCLLVHHPLELPFVLALILATVANNPRKSVDVLRYAQNGKNVCAEANFQAILETL